MGFVKGITEMFRVLCEDRRLSLMFQRGMAAAEVYMEVDKMEKVLGNLLSNAVKFTPPGGAIYVRVDEDGTEVTITVRDSGIGIDPAHLPLVFDRFYQVGLAEALYMDRSTLYRKLQKETGRTPSQLINEMRLQQAALLLQQEAGTVSEIAYGVGFNSLAYFSFCFKEKYGVPPSEFDGYSLRP
ncbi:MAG: helix-turn-helix domain-containing protein [Balneolales bacterium]